MKEKSNKQKDNNPIVNKATLNIEWIIKADGETSLKRTCDGFNPLELLGLLALMSQEVTEHIKGKIKPDIIEHNVILNNKKL